jgi:uncharacterized protein YidB (DUF937 family)
LASSRRINAPQAAPASPSQPDGGGLFGGLGGFLDKLKDAGQGAAASSWVATGSNTPIQPGQLSQALGQTTISDLAQHAGMSEQDLLAQLSQILPGVVDKLTPNGRIPSQSELASLLQH